MSSFWDRKLAPQGPARPAPTVPTTGAWFMAPPPQRASQLVPQPQAHLPTRLQAPSAHRTERCPGCDSGNYLDHCFDCGYPLVQSGSGMVGTGGTSAKPAKQLDSFVNAGYHPEIIIEHIRM